MQRRQTAAAKLWVSCSLGLVIVVSAGCAALPPNSFLDPLALGQFPAKYRETGIRRVLTPLDTPPGLPNAVGPTAEDLVPIYEEYRLGTGDQVAIVIDDLLSQGLQETMVQEVTATGYVRLQRLGRVKVTGMTETELEDELKARLRDAKILPDAIVRVIVQVKRQRVFSIIGSVAQPGPYAIVEPDMRLLDAIGYARDIGAEVRKLYVIRRAGSEPAVPDETARMPSEVPESRDLIVLPPEEEEEREPMPGALGMVANVTGAAWQEEPPATTQQRRELEELIDPRQERPVVTQPSDSGRRFQPIVIDPLTGEPIDVRPATRAAERPAPPEAVKPPGEAQDFDWEDVPDYELAQRVIEIDVDALRAGDPRQNIVIRDRDVIQVPVDTGVFYLLGEVNRPGVYAFAGREVTLKRALALAGGFGALAWPSRCEIIRREPGTDTEVTVSVNLDAIFGGREPDVELRSNDIVNVGTHVAAPFLFVIRNSFRFTYGFGFVYDRNFADQDAIAGRQNPETLARQRRQSRGLPF